MDDSEIPEERKGFTEIIKEEFVETEEGMRGVKVVKHSSQLIVHPRSPISDNEEGEKDFSLPRASEVRLRHELHDADHEVHVYKVELISPRYFSQPIVFEVVLDRDGKVIEPKTERFIASDPPNLT